MRTFRWNAPIIGAGALALSLLSPALLPLKAAESGADDVAAAMASEPQTYGWNELKSRLDQSDRAVAFQALQMALTELGDGVTLVWRRSESQLVGRIKPVSAFRDDQGRICRHLVYTLTLGAYERKVEGVACREEDGSWSLTG
jgi:surface antigen